MVLKSMPSSSLAADEDPENGLHVVAFFARKIGVRKKQQIMLQAIAESNNVDLVLQDRTTLDQEYEPFASTWI